MIVSLRNRIVQQSKLVPEEIELLLVALDLLHHLILEIAFICSTLVDAVSIG